MDRSNITQSMTSSTSSDKYPLSLDEYTRYGRQMILPGFGLPGQLKLKQAKVAVVGAGGLGCPVLQYIVGAGVGTIGIFDHDTVGISNLHRQVLHTTDRIGMNKAESACLALKALNPHPKLVPHPIPVLPTTSLELLHDYDIIVDCTDRPITRYLLSDTAVRLDKTLVSGAAISSAGQWAVYGGYYGDQKAEPSDAVSSGSQERHGKAEGSKDVKGKRRACYRCVWPSLLPGSGGNGTCEEQGVWGAVTGIIGTGMASEVVKLTVGVEDDQPLLHLLHLNSNPLIRSIKLRPPSPKCIACGPSATITDDLSLFEYETFCSGVVAGLESLEQGTTSANGEDTRRIRVEDLAQDGVERRLIDTRPRVEFGICALPNSINIPFENIVADPLSILPHVEGKKEVTFICRKGNDSQIAASALKRALKLKHSTSRGAQDGAKMESNSVIGAVPDANLQAEAGETYLSDEGIKIEVNDVVGGLVAWSRDVDPEFPIY